MALLPRALRRSIPWVGTALAVLAVASTVRRKGIVGGAVDSALNATPVLGTLKLVAERMRGRDFIRDRPPRVSAPA